MHSEKQQLPEEKERDDDKVNEKEGKEEDEEEDDNEEEEDESKEDDDESVSDEEFKIEDEHLLHEVEQQQLTEPETQRDTIEDKLERFTQQMKARQRKAERKLQSYQNSNASDTPSIPAEVVSSRRSSSSKHPTPTPSDSEVPEAQTVDPDSELNENQDKDQVQDNEEGEQKKVAGEEEEAAEQEDEEEEDPLTVETLVEILQEERIQNLCVIDVRGRCQFADFFINGDGRSTRHSKGMMYKIRNELKRREAKNNVSKGKSASANLRNVNILNSGAGELEGNEDWIVIDMGRIVINIFSEGARKYYDLDGKWIMTMTMEEQDEEYHKVSQEDKMDELFDDVADDSYAKWNPDDGDVTDNDADSTEIQEFQSRRI